MGNQWAAFRFSWFVLGAVAFQMIVFSLYATCVPDGSHSIFSGGLCHLDDWKYVWTRILVVFGWTSLAALSNARGTGEATLRGFILGAAPALIFAVYGLFMGISTHQTEVLYYGNRVSADQLDLEWMRDNLKCVMVGVSYGIVGGLFARRTRSAVLALAIGLGSLAGQIAVDFCIGMAGFYGYMSGRLMS